MLNDLPKHRKSLILALGAFLVLGLILQYGAVRNSETSPYWTENGSILPGAQPSNQPTATNPENMKHRITLNTNKGEIVFETFDGDAPVATSKFIELANKGAYDNVIFHRIISGFMIQGGDVQFGRLPEVVPGRLGTGGPGYKFDDELDPKSEAARNGYKKGIVAMANAGPNTNGSQFFIMLRDYPLPINYTIFGRVVSGQEVVDAIGGSPTDSSTDRPIEDVFIKNVKVEATD